LAPTPATRIVSSAREPAPAERPLALEAGLDRRRRVPAHADQHRGSPRVWHSSSSTSAAPSEQHGNCDRTHGVATEEPVPNVSGVTTLIRPCSPRPRRSRPRDRRLFGRDGRVGAAFSGDPIDRRSANTSVPGTGETPPRRLCVRCRHRRGRQLPLGRGRALLVRAPSVGSSRSAADRSSPARDSTSETVVSPPAGAPRRAEPRPSNLPGPACA